MIVTREIVAPHSFTWQEGHGRFLSVLVWANNHPLNVFVVDGENFQRYKSGNEFSHQGPGTVRFFGQVVQMPHEGPWFLVVENPTDVEVEADLKID